MDKETILQIIGNDFNTVIKLKTKSDGYFYGGQIHNLTETTITIEDYKDGFMALDLEDVDRVWRQ